MVKSRNFKKENELKFKFSFDNYISNQLMENFVNIESSRDTKQFCEDLFNTGKIIESNFDIAMKIYDCNTEELIYQGSRIRILDTSFPFFVSKDNGWKSNEVSLYSLGDIIDKVKEKA